MKTRIETFGGAWSSRRGFTLIELLVVMAIIGVLVGLSAAAIMRSLWRAQEVAIHAEISQLDAAVRSFKEKYGFYPPDFWNINHPDPSLATGLNGFIPYLNRIAPNHAEFAPAFNPDNGTRRIDIWWNDVGQYLSPESAMVFWLSGIAKNKQFPLTTGLPNNVQALTAYNYGPVERELLYDFKSGGRLFNPGTGLPLQFDNAGVPLPENWVAAYTQSTGRYEPFIYLELNSLPDNTVPDRVPRGRMLRVGSINPNVRDFTVYPYAFNLTGTPVTNLYNRDSFQIISPGVDAVFSYRHATLNPNGETYNADLMVNNTNSLIDRRERDNQSNIAEGNKLEVLLLAN